MDELGSIGMNPWLLLLNGLLGTGLLLWICVLFDPAPVRARLRSGWAWLSWRPLPDGLGRLLLIWVGLGMLAQTLIVLSPVWQRLNHPILTVLFSIASFQGLACAVICWSCSRRERSLEECLGLQRRLKASDLLWGLGGYCLSLPFVVLSALGTQLLFEFFNWELQSQALLQASHDLQGHLVWVALFILVGFVGPFCEEVMFRGWLLTRLNQQMGPWPALLIHSWIFAVIHMHGPSMLPLFFLSILLGLLFVHTRRLWVCVWIHAIFNSVTLVQLLVQGEEALM